MARKDSRPSREDWREYAIYSTLGIELAVTVLLCAYIGYRLDMYFRTKPWIMIAGIALGFAASLLNIYERTTGHEGKGDE